MGEILFGIVLIGLLVGAFIYFRQWWWVAVMGTICGIVLLAEGIAVIATGRTLSQMFWAWSKESPVEGWITIGALCLGWAILMFHLAWKMI